MKNPVVVVQESFYKTDLSFQLTKKKDGGLIHKFQSGGKIPGYGGGDTVPILAEKGEYIVNKQAAKEYTPFLESINSGSVRRFQTGGQVGYLAKGGRPSQYEDIADLLRRIPALTGAAATDLIQRERHQARVAEAMNQWMREATENLRGLTEAVGVNADALREAASQVGNFEKVISEFEGRFIESSLMREMPPTLSSNDHKPTDKKHCKFRTIRLAI